MSPRIGFTLCVLAAMGISCGGSSEGPAKTPEPAPAASSAAPAASSAAAPAPSGNTVEVLLCDGKTKTRVLEGTPGTSISGSLMAEWLRQNPNSNWEAEEKERHKLVEPADNNKLVSTSQVTS